MITDFYSVLQLLKRFGIYIYTGNKADDIGLMQLEVKELFDNGLVSKDDYVKAVVILRSELSK